MTQYFRTLLLSEFDAVFVVDRESRRYSTLICRDGLFTLVLPEGLYEEGLGRMTPNMLPEDRERFVREADFGLVLHRLEAGGKVEVRYRLRHGNEDWLCRSLTYVPAEDGKHILVGLRDKTDEVMEQIRDANALALKNSCIKFMVSNLCENLMTVDVRTGQSLTLVAAGNGNVLPKQTFSEQIRWFADNVVVPEERETYLRYFDLDTLVAHIKENGGTVSMFCTVLYADGRHELLIRTTLVRDTFDLQGEHLLLFAQDMTSIRKIEETNRQLVHSSRYDKLTGLLNRATAEKLAGDYLASAGPVGTCCFLLLDIDYFKNANDRFGHLVGDDVLKWLGQSIRKSFRAGDVLSRWGGDEFVIFLKDAVDREGIRARLGTLRSMMLCCHSGKMSLPVTLSIGGAFSIGEDSLTDLYRRADEALYQVKQKGRNGIRLV